MTELCLLIAIQGGTPCEALEPAYQFAASHHVARANECIAAIHRDRVVSTYESWCNSAWQFRQDRVQYAWKELGVALNETLPFDRRIEAMNNVRQAIGGEAFERRAMPCPIPHYEFAPSSK